MVSTRPSASRDRPDSRSRNWTLPWWNRPIVLYVFPLHGQLRLDRIAGKSHCLSLGLTICVSSDDPCVSQVFLPLLYDLTVGTATESEVCPYYTDLLKGTGVRHIQASLDTLDTADAALLTATLQPTTSRAPDTLQFRAGVVAVGASPDSILQRVPGAVEYAQPFYTATHAKQTRRLLNRLEQQQQQPQSSDDNDNGNQSRRIAVVGGGFGGVELAASVQRRLRQAQGGAYQVTLLSRGAPMAGTRAEAWIDRALTKLGVIVQDCSVESLARSEKHDNKVLVRRRVPSASGKNDNDESIGTVVEDEWDAVLWTAGSGPADPVGSGKCVGLLQDSSSGRLAVDSTLRCLRERDQLENQPAASARQQQQPYVWALGDCAKVIEDENQKSQSMLPKTAQVAMQQADTVASNLLVQIVDENPTAKTFVYQDLGSMLTLGGPNGAVLAPREGTFAPVFAPLLDSTASALRVADDLWSNVGGLSPVEQLGLSPEQLGMSLGSHGLGVPDGAAPGTLAGTLSGAARRTVYAVRMPTNQQRAVSVVSAAISTAASLAREASDRARKKK